MCNANRYKDRIKVACVNFHAIWGNKVTNLHRMGRYIEELAGEGSELIIFPELALTGAAPVADPGLYGEQAEPIPGPATDKIATLAEKLGIYVILGMPEQSRRLDHLSLYNSAAIIGPKGLIGTYRKIHLHTIENRWAKPGEAPLVFKSPWGPIGVGICYDFYAFPEIARIYALRGARLLAHLAAFTYMPGCEDHHLTMLKARVIENWVFVASANMVGAGTGQRYFGMSLIAGPNPPSQAPKLLAGPASKDEEEIVAAELELSKVGTMQKVDPLFIPDPYTGRPGYKLEVYVKELLAVLRDQSKYRE